MFGELIAECRQVLEREKGRYDPRWRQKGLSTATAIAQAREVGRATGAAQQHRAFGGETGESVFAAPGAAQTFRAAGGARGKVRLGKKAAGRELDGRTWDEVPT